jgi:predicted unusual protein kinase regulating ubiquinone biosynthesis (AarF/ABC1/UbiB family)
MLLASAVVIAAMRSQLVSAFVPTSKTTVRMQLPLQASIDDLVSAWTSSGIPSNLQTSAQTFLEETNKRLLDISTTSFTTESMNLDALTAGAAQTMNGMLQALPFDVDTTALSTLWASIISTAFVSNPWHTAAIVVFSLGTWLQLAVLQSPIDFTKGDTPFPPGADTYSPEQAEKFYNQRRGLVLKRVLQLAFLTSGFTSGILFDWLVLGKLLKDENYTALKRNEPRRAKVALTLAESLGPTFIKLGQALSIRTDLIPEAYALELRALQDQVSPFPNEQARDILKQEFGVLDLSLIFRELTQDPVASASVGQVYKGVLAVNGKEVAVKVQRPGILSEIALDLYILRLFTPIQTRLQNAANGVETSQEDIDLAVALVDEWGRGFVAETDYRLEAENTINFQAAMVKRKLDAVCAPTVVPELVRDKVLVTEWVQGTRLDLDASSDVPRLCGVAINAYLTMLLDTGVLHCDPHKGNLLRTTDGKLCILDWGMTLDVPKDLQYSLLEFIAHLNVEDYDAIPQDFINLGFSDATPERLQASGITEGLSFAFRQLAAGGGPKKIQERVKAEFQERYGADLSDEELRTAARAEMMQRMEDQLAAEGVDVKGVTNIMEEVSRRNRELFALPPYVLYLARAFSTLEGIGLSIDENYSIIQECYPYLSSRLFTDRNPRAKKALKTMLGLEDEQERMHDPNSALALVQQATLEAATHDGTRLNGFSPAKLAEMTEGFTSYTSSTGDVDAEKGQAKAAKEFGKLFLDPKGSTLQDIFVEEAAKFGDTMTRRALRGLLVDNVAAKAASTILRGPKQALERNKQFAPDFFFNSPLKSLLIDQPAAIPDLVESLLAPTNEDEKIMRTVEELILVINQSLSTSESSSSIPANASPQSVASTLQDLLANEETRATLVEQLPGVVALSRRLSAGLLRRAAYRTDISHQLPEEARRRIKEVNTVLADAVEPPMVTEEEVDIEA